MGDSKIDISLLKAERRLKIIFFYIFILVPIVFMVSCKQEKADISEKGSYFDLKAVVEDDIAYNTKNACAELKQVMVNSIQERKFIANVDWYKELQAILESDINKPAWKGKFLVDTIMGDLSGQYTIQYSAISDKINIKLLKVSFVNGHLEKIYILKQIQSFIFASNQTIEYFPKKGFKVSGEQRAVMMKKFDLNVEVNYSCK